MVPGMTERERLAADLRRLEWLADAARGPSRPEPPFTPLFAAEAVRQVPRPTPAWSRIVRAWRALRGAIATTGRTATEPTRRPTSDPVG